MLDVGEGEGERGEIHCLLYNGKYFLLLNIILPVPYWVVQLVCIHNLVGFGSLH